MRMHAREGSGYATLALHLLVEYWHCDAAVLDDSERLLALLQDAAAAAGTTVIHTYGHRFSPQGVSVVVVIQESHLSIHTWPEQGYAAVDFYTCGSGSPSAAHEVLLRGLAAETCRALLIRRGAQQSPQVLDSIHMPARPVAAAEG